MNRSSVPGSILAAGRKPALPGTILFSRLPACLASAVLWLLLFPSPLSSSDGIRRPKLQIINGSDQLIDVFWLKTETERVPNGSVAPGKDSVITTTIGHRFTVIGRTDHSEVTLESLVPVQAFRFDPVAKNGVPAFYTQSIRAHSYPIVASAKVNPCALKEAAYLIDMMLAKRSDVREAMIKSGSRLCILAWNEFTTDQPEFAWLGESEKRGLPEVSGKDYIDARARGLGGSATDPFCSCAEENLLGYPGDPYSTECILIHEFAHNIHLRGMNNLDPTFDARLKAAYGAAMQAGLWKGKYAGANHHEYFAEGVQSWFDNNRENDIEHNHVNTRAELLAYDPGLAAMCREVFGDTVLKYTKPTTRLTGHLAGYDPAKAPTFVWPERLQKAKALIKKQAKARSAAANNGSERETRDIAGWSVRISTVLLLSHRAETERALDLIRAQLEQIVRVVPAPAVAELKKVPIYLSPEYPGARPKAEYHPDAGWLRDHGRDAAMAKAVEITSALTFEESARRMPMLLLHELAHGYHHQVLGHDHAAIKAAYARAKTGGKYDRVERRDAGGNTRLDRHYALTNEKEYFAECSEAFFGRNDFFPYTRAELRQHDPEMFELVGQLWNKPGLSQ